jgi:hypothetical protein
MRLAINLFLRAGIVFFMLDSIVNAGDDRYAGKGLNLRNVVIVLVWSMVFPALYRLWHKWKEYPWDYDNLYLSVFWLDMFGNYLNFYNNLGGWDTLPHFHGPGALAIVVRGLGQRSVMAATGIATMVHVALEIQEYVGDQLGGTQNVNGAGDTAHDLAAGLLGAWVYVGGYALYERMIGDHRRRDPAELINDDDSKEPTRKAA